MIYEDDQLVLRATIFFQVHRNASLERRAQKKNTIKQLTECKNNNPP